MSHNSVPGPLSLTIILQLFHDTLWALGAVAVALIHCDWDPHDPLISALCLVEVSWMNSICCRGSFFDEGWELHLSVSIDTLMWTWKESHKIHPLDKESQATNDRWERISLSQWWFPFLVIQYKIAAEKRGDILLSSIATGKLPVVPQITPMHPCSRQVTVSQVTG